MVAVLEVTPEVRAAREKWQFTGRERPDFADPVPAGSESVWDFPRPPRVEPVSLPLKVVAGGEVIAETQNGVRVCETAGAPTYYFPPDDVDVAVLEQRSGSAPSLCEWKGVAEALALHGIDVGWRYVATFPEFTSLARWPSFYPNRVQCFVGEELAIPQPGGYYGGWVTASLCGPIKGEAGSGWW